MTMNYENLYKNALERARVWKEKSGMPKNKQGILDDIFPQLKESEDEKIRKDIIKMVTNTCKGEWFIDSSKEECLSWLEKQGEQKPQRMISAEAKEAMYAKPAWSEEDERICQCLIEDQENTLDEVRNDKYGHSEIISDLKEMYRERIDWLKSLKDRYTWKPSDEQMEVLKEATSIVGSKYKSCLNSLYSDLKKLKD